MIEAIEEGKSFAEISRLFKLSRHSVYRWLRRKQESGDVKAKQGYQRGSNHKISDLGAFEAFMKEQEGKSLRDIAKSFSQWGSASTIGRTLRALKLSYKKNISAS